MFNVFFNTIIQLLSNIFTNPHISVTPPPQHHSAVAQTNTREASPSNNPLDDMFIRCMVVLFCTFIFCYFMIFHAISDTQQNIRPVTTSNTEMSTESGSDDETPGSDVDLQGSPGSLERSQQRSRN